MKIRAIDLTHEHIGRIIRFTGSNGFTCKTRMRLNHFTTYSDSIKLSDSFDEYYYVGHETEIELEETK